MGLTVLDVTHRRLASISPEIHSKGHCYAALDVRRDVLIVAQRMAAIKSLIEECVGEPVSLASLFESCNLQLRKGRTGSFSVTRLTADELPSFLDEQQPRFARTLIGAVNPANWQLAPA